MTKSKRIEAAYTNEFKQTFNPGDSCIVVTTACHRVSIERAVYVGYVERNAYDWRSRKYDLQKFVQIKRPIDTWYKGKWQTLERITTLQDNNILGAGSTADDLMKVV